MEKKQKSFWEKVDNVPSVVFLLLPMILISIPIIHPLGIPLTITDYTRNTVNIINKLPAGSVVAVVDGATPIMDPPNGGAMVALWKYLWSRHIKTIFMQFRAEGLAVPYLKSITLANPDSFGLKYGEDYVVFGYLAGDEMAVASFAADMAKAYPLDIYNHPTKSLPLMQKINSLKDVQLTITSIDLCTQPDFLVRQISQAYKIPQVMILSQGCSPSVAPYYPQQIQGIIVDLPGSAEIEKLTGYLGIATVSVDAQSIGGLLVLAIFLASNVIMIGLKFSRRKVKQ